MSRVIVLLGFGLILVTVNVQGGSMPPELQEAGKVAREACLAETGATVENIENISDGIFAEDDKSKCYIKCALEKFQIFEGDSINYDVILAMIPPEAMERGTRAIEICRSTTGKDSCDLAYNAAKCVQKEDPEDFCIP